jgi:hypothetical protein
MPDDRSWDTHVSESLFEDVDFFAMPSLVPEYDEYSGCSDSLASGRRMAWSSWDYGEDRPGTPTDIDFVEDLLDELAELEEVQSTTEKYLLSLEWFS